MKLGVAILSHNRSCLLENAVRSVISCKWDDIILADNSTSAVESKRVKAIAKLVPEIRFRSIRESGLFANLENLINLMRDDVSYLLLCDDDSISVDSKEIDLLRSKCYLPILRARQGKINGWKHEKGGVLSKRWAAIRYLVWFPNLAFAGMFIHGSIYKMHKKSLTVFGNEFDLFLVSKQLGCECNMYLTEYSSYEYSSHPDQLSSIPAPIKYLRSVPRLIREVVLFRNYTLFSLYLRAWGFCVASWCVRHARNLKK
jgi:hypothetical protein